jgi:hypothetical protein
LCEIGKSLLRGGLHEEVELDPHQWEGMCMIYGEQKEPRRLAPWEQRVTRLFVWDMGTGKTHLTLAALCRWRGTVGTAGSALVVAQKHTIFSTWRDHFQRFASSVPVTYLTTHKQLLGEPGPGQPGGGRVFVVTQSLLSRAFRRGWTWDKEGETYVDKAGSERRRGAWVRASGCSFLEATFAMVFIDEVHEARSVERKAVLGKALRQVCSRAYKTVGLTGTPVWNKPVDMAGVLAALDARTHLVQPQSWADRTLHRGAVQHCCRTYIHRVKQSAIGLPPLRRSTVTVAPALTGEAKTAYNELYEAAKSLGGGPTAEGGDSFQLVLCLNQMSRTVLHPLLGATALPSTREAAAERLALALAQPSPKLLAAVQTVRDMLLRHRKIVVTGNSLQFIHLVRISLQNGRIAAPSLLGRPSNFMQIDGLLLDGQVSAEGRASMVQRFLQPDGPRILFLSMKAGGTGLNITPGATGMLVLDLWYSPAIHRQVEKRIHRRGQDEPVEIVQLVCAGTIEEAILQLHDEKTDCAEVMVGDRKMTVEQETWRKHQRILAACKPIV